MLHLSVYSHKCGVYFSGLPPTISRRDAEFDKGHIEKKALAASLTEDFWTVGFVDRVIICSKVAISNSADVKSMRVAAAAWICSTEAILDSYCCDSQVSGKSFLQLSGVKAPVIFYFQCEGSQRWC